MNAAGTGHAFIRPGQVAPDRPARDACMQCGLPEAGHVTGAAAAARRLENLAGVLGAALATWAGRDDANAQPGVRQAANTAVGAIDGMLAELHQVRSRLVTEIRQSDDAAMARVDAMLAAYRGGDR